jgi:hypothetical protein
MLTSILLVETGSLTLLLSKNLVIIPYLVTMPGTLPTNMAQLALHILQGKRVL